LGGTFNKFQAIKAFARVAEHGGFTAAAEKLGTSASAVTKMVSRLETDLGTRLINRNSRSIMLTEYGELFYRRATRVISDLEDAERMVRDSSSTPQGQVRAIVPYSFGRVTLIPALDEFYRRYTSIDLDIQFNDNAVDLIKGGYDLAVRTGELPNSGLIRRVLLKTPMVTVASPEYLRRRGVPHTPDDLRRHNCIIGRRFGAEWQFNSDDGELAVSVDGNLRLDSGDAVREAAVYGLGIAHSTLWLFRKDIEAGSLVTILDDFQLDGVPVSVLYSAKRHLPAKVTTVIDFLVELTSGGEETIAHPGKRKARHLNAATQAHIQPSCRS
jgi:LysR family transcriptional regulator, regulator for bpeEF and oprC